MSEAVSFFDSLISAMISHLPGFITVYSAMGMLAILMATTLLVYSRIHAWTKWREGLGLILVGFVMLTFVILSECLLGRCDPEWIGSLFVLDPSTSRAPILYDLWMIVLAYIFIILGIEITCVVFLNKRKLKRGGP